MDLDRVQELYDLQTSAFASPEQQQKAKEKIAEIADTLTEQYLATLVWGDNGGPNKGRPKFDCYGALYCRTVMAAQTSGNILGMPVETDLVGTILLHRRYIALGH